MKFEMCDSMIERVQRLQRKDASFSSNEFKFFSRIPFFTFARQNEGVVFKKIYTSSFHEIDISHSRMTKTVI
jgi:hypothetical protein